MSARSKMIEIIPIVADQSLSQSHSLTPRGLQYARLPYPSLSPRVAQILVHWVSDTIQPSHPLLPYSFFTFNLFQHQGLFQLVCSCINRQNIRASASASAFPMNIQGWFSLGLTGLTSLLSKGLSRVFSSTIIWKHQFFTTQPSLCSNCHICTWLPEKQ